LIKDIRLIAENDPCPRCGAPVKTARGIEIGQVFKLYTKYSECLNASYLDENGKDKPFFMGCYSIGVSRTLASVIEQHNDEHGIIWPVAVAPYHVVVIPINAKDEAQLELATAVYDKLNEAGIETVLDDRRERPGVKFKDADLIGYPLKITVGPKAISEQLLEVKDRQTGEQFLLPVADYVLAIQKLLKLK
jgi:prolyl-tRNA synthetase